jgi:EAL domain-containing protein (putative c-di-GMP-specific phosphodiesterase class I)
MYQAKAEGKHRFCLFSPEMDQQLERRQQIEHALPRATEGGLQLVFQPIVQIDGGRVSGFEALLRWQHPVLGTVSPAEFVPVAEHSGDIAPIGEWVLREACDRLREWRLFDPALGMSVNLSARQLADDGTVDRLCAVLRDSGLPPRAVDLEITEGHAVVQSPEMAARLARIRAAGFGLAIDDFGVGYSSLSYLARLPVTRLKIDRSFVSAMDEGAHQGAIIRSVVAIGQALQLSVVAEGIETAEQARRLGEIGCTLAQGWLFGRPMPAAEAAVLLRQRAVVPLTAMAPRPLARLPG